jgi:hypothetical protein
VDAIRREGNNVGVGTTTKLMSDDPWKNKDNWTVSTTTTATTHPPVIANTNYDAVLAWCRHHIHTGSDFLFQPDHIFQEALQDAARSFDFPIQSLHSLFRNLHVHYVKTTSSIQVRRQFQSLYLPLYLQNTPPLHPPHKQIPQQQQQPSWSILQLAKRANYPPYLFCRLLVEQITDLSSLSLSPSPVSPTLPAMCQAATSVTATIPTTTETSPTSQTELATTSSLHCSPRPGAGDGGSGETRSTTPATNNTTTAKKSLTLAMRDPMGMLGDIRVIRPEYWASESIGDSQPTSNNNDVATIFTPATGTVHQPQQQQHQQEQQHPEKEQVLNDANDSPAINDITATVTCLVSTEAAATEVSTRLAREVQEAIASDPMYGPKQDKERHWIGVEYEVLLEHTLTEMGTSRFVVPFCFFCPQVPHFARNHTLLEKNS